MKRRVFFVTLRLVLCGGSLFWGLRDAHALPAPPAARADGGSSTQPAPELAPPRASAAVAGANPAYVGQMTELEVELWRDNRADNQAAPFFPELRVHGAISILSPTAPPPEERRAEGVTFLVQRRHYLLFAERAGRVLVPPIRILLPAPGGKSVAVQTQPVALDAMAVSSASGSAPLVARQVRLERVVDGNLDELRVGDAVTLSIRLSAED